jgi:hypothetical protein
VTYPPQHSYDQPWPPYAPPQAPPRRRPRRIFLWVFLAIQALFVVWVITGAAGGGSIHSDAVAYCHAHPDQFLPFAQCVSDYGGGEKAGTAIGVGLVVVLWAVTDIILGVSYGVWRLARR